MFHREYTNSNISYKYTSSTENEDSDSNSRDPGREIIQKNVRNRLQRIANQTKEELDKVLKRVDTTLSNYEYSVQSSLIQHGLPRDDVSNVEYLTDIKELESLLNDSLAKQRYKQRLTIFIVGQTEKVEEKIQLLQQIGQFFIEQKQNFSAKEFYSYDETTETQNETDQALKSFDVKDCFVHVKQLGTQLNEVNEQIIEYLVQTAAAKQQAKGKKKPAQISKEIKEQLSNLQSKLDQANTEIINRDDQIQCLEREVDQIRQEIEMNQNNQRILNDELNECKIELKSYKNHTKELENEIQLYEYQKNESETVQSIISRSDAEDTTDTRTTNKTTEDKDNNLAQISVSIQIDNEEGKSTTFSDKEIQTVEQAREIIDHNEHVDQNNIEEMSDLNLLFKSTDGIDLNNVTNENLPTVFASLRNFAICRVRELLRELEIRESINNERIQNLVQQFDEYKITCEQIEVQKQSEDDTSTQLKVDEHNASQEALNQLQLLNSETETLEQQNTLENVTSLAENTNPLDPLLNNQFSSSSKGISEENESIIKCPPTSVVDEEKLEVNQVSKQANIVVLPSTTMDEKISLENIPENKDETDKNQSTVEQDQQQQQTSERSSRHGSEHAEEITIPATEKDQFKVGFFYVYDIIYKFRHAITKLLEKNKFTFLADRLQIIQQLSSDSHATHDFIKNSECVLKDTVKILQICLTTLQTTINEYQIKESSIEKEPEPINEPSIIDNQQSLILQEKEFVIADLTAKYERATILLDEANKKHKEALDENENLMLEQKKLIRSLRYEILHLQKRLTKVEAEGIMEPSIMFTRLDAERNEQALQHAVHKGKVPEETYTELKTAMTDYIRLPSQQFGNLVKRYIQFRKAVEIENRIANYVRDHGKKRSLEKIETLYERRSNQIGALILHIRQRRAFLARTITEKFDSLENESSIFLIRPLYSYQGRTATQSYMQYDKRRREALLTPNATKRKHYTSRQSAQSQSTSSSHTDEDQEMLTQPPTMNSPYDGEPQFHIETSFPVPSSPPTGQQNNSTGINTDDGSKLVQLSELTRLQELDIQRSLMPMSHASTPLLSAFTNKGIDPCVPSLNLRSYVALTRPGIGHDRIRKPTETIVRVSRESVSTLSAKSRERNPRTPYNSTAGDLKRNNSPLPLIKRPFISNMAASVHEKQHGAFVPSLNTNEVSTTN
ncbi:unnamed protein product [Rotaria magnacalcarata]|uniref:Uncharacterized protein n=1 Tax=Rotaria magnacalcarata TaxID=392030 RepID=A0A816GQP6_9BILA|nr:unnamed protein product [Rotaria magnacalcarata]